jgi:hypothetical protein
MRIRVSDVLDLFAAGLSAEQILEELPDLEMDDLNAALAYASRKLNHPVLERVLKGISCELRHMRSPLTPLKKGGNRTQSPPFSRGI